MARPVGRRVSFPCSKRGRRRRQGGADLPAGAQAGVESNPSQGDDHFHVAEHPQLVQKIGLAVGDFLTIRSVAGRRAVEHLRDVAIVEGETVLAMGRRRPACETEAVQGFVQPITAAVAREGASRAVGAMRCRGQSDDQEPGERVAEAGNGFAPIGFASESAHLLFCHLLAVRHEPGAAAAVADAFLDLRQPAACDSGLVAVHRGRSKRHPAIDDVDRPRYIGRPRGQERHDFRHLLRLSGASQRYP